MLSILPTFQAVGYQMHSVQKLRIHVCVLERRAIGYGRSIVDAVLSAPLVLQDSECAMLLLASPLRIVSVARRSSPYQIEAGLRGWRVLFTLTYLRIAIYIVELERYKMH